MLAIDLLYTKHVFSGIIAAAFICGVIFIFCPTFEISSQLAFTKPFALCSPMRSLPYFTELFKLADAADLFRDPDHACAHMRQFIGSAGKA